MPNKELWTTKPDHEDVIRAIRNDLIVRLAKDKLGYGKLSHRDISEIIKVAQPSVTRVLRHGKNTSKPGASA